LVADHLDEAATRLKVEQATQREAEEELEDLRSSVVWVQNLVLGDVSKLSLTVLSMAVVTEQLDDRIDAAAANRVCWGSHSTLVAAVLHFPDLGTDLEVLGTERNMGLKEDEVNALWSRVHAAADSLRRTFLLRLPVTLLTAWGSSGGSLCR
jgi:hypothetical protein